MINRVERELIRLREKLCEKYDLKAMNISGSIDEFNSILPDDIQTALKFWFDVRVRKVSNDRSRVTSRMIEEAVYEDLGISLPHKMIGGIMISIIGKDNVMASDDLVSLDPVFLFNNVELIELDKCAPLKIFIAQPMSGVPDEEVEALRMKIMGHIKDRYNKINDLEIIDQFHIPENELPKDGVKYPRIHMLGRSIQFLADADLVVFYGDFTHSKGCSVELAVCKEYGIPYVVVSDKDIDNRFKLTFEPYVVNISNEIPEGYIYVSDANYDEEVIVTRLPFKKLLTLRNVPAPPNHQHMSGKYTLINFKTAYELMVDLDDLGDVIRIARPTPFHNWGLSKTGEPLIID